MGWERKESDQCALTLFSHPENHPYLPSPLEQIASKRVRREVKVLIAQLCPTLCNPMNCSLPGSLVPLSLEFSRQECWSGQPFPSLDTFLTQGSNRFPALQEDSLLSEPTGKQKKSQKYIFICMSNKTIYLLVSTLL